MASGEGDHVADGQRGDHRVGAAGGDEVDGDQDLLTATLERIFSEHSAPADRRAAEDVGWAGGCWQALDGADLLRVGVPEAVGGAGGTVADACTVLRLAGRHAVALPLAEVSLLAGWFTDAGLELPPGVLSVAPPAAESALHLTDGRVTGTAQRVPWGARADAVLAVADADGRPCAVVLDPLAATAHPGRNLAGEPRDALVWDGAAVAAEARRPVDDRTVAALELRGELARTLLMAGALQRTAELTVAHARSRTQFGRPVAAFQAVAHRLVQMTAETELVALAATVAARRFALAGIAAAFEVRAAGTVARGAVYTVTAHAHQVHGAIGFTREHELADFTRRLWSWRAEWGSERRLARLLGNQVVAAGPSSLWAQVAGG